MSKFKVRLKIQGLELEIDGSREDVPAIAHSLQQQVGGLMNPAGTMIEGELEPAKLAAVTVSPEAPAKARRRRRRPTQGGGAPNGESRASADAAKDFRHSPEDWGFPRQDWTTAVKSVWLLYVVEKQDGSKELTAKEIALTFNKHFKQAGAIKAHNVTRDLGKLKAQAPSQVSEDTGSTPSRWFLTTAGYQRAEELVIEARGGTA